MADVSMNTNKWEDHWWPAPAKLNLVLNIIGRRDDGYHELQTMFQLVAMSDWLNFVPTTDGTINLSCSSNDIAITDNLVMRAGLLLKERSGTSLGSNIILKKILPMGSGLGGGSSDAATTLVVLNKVWGLGYSVNELLEIGLELGADVPIFVLGRSAWAEGVGEKLEPVDLPETWFVIVNSSYHCSTKEIFQHNCLTRDNEAITIRDFLDGQTKNDCFPVVRRLSKELDGIYRQFTGFSTVYLTGTGSSMFAKCSNRQEAVSLSDALPADWNKWVVKGVNESPLQKSLKQFSNRLNKV